MQATQKKPALRRTLDSIIRFTSSIGENTVFTGSFNGGENIVVRGHVRGESDVKGAVVVTETGKWQGKLVADVVIISGIVEGDIVAREKIEVLAGARIYGNLTGPVIAIEIGAVHDGHMDMSSATRIERFYEKREDPARVVEE